MQSMRKNMETTTIICKTMCSDEIGFGAFMTKESRQFDVTPGLTACNNIDCSNKTFVNTESCECGTVHYCCPSCRKNDYGHRCPTRDTGVSFHEVEPATVLFSRPGGGKIVFYGLFKGVKEGKKFVRGTFNYSGRDGFIGTYSGGFTSIKRHGVVCATPHGKGIWINSPLMSSCCLYENGAPVNGCITSMHGVESYVTYDSEIKVLPLVIYQRNGVKFAGSIHEVQMHGTCTARDSHDSWKNTVDAMCIEFKGSGSDGVPVVISKEEMYSRFNRSKVIKTETVEKTRFRTCVHWNGEEEFTSDLPFILSFSSCATCNMHGKWNLASVCEIFTIDEVVKMDNENDVDFSCSCTLKNVILPNDCLFPKPIPSKIPKVKNDGKKGKKRGKNQNTTTKDKSIRGVSTRNMVVEGNSDDDFSQVLADGGWALKRQKNHLVYQRIIEDVRQNYVCSKTPSCSRWEKNAIRDLKNIERRT